MTTNRFRPASGFVETYGGGTVTVSVDRTTENYPDGRVVIVPEELWDQMLPPVPLPDLLKPLPVFPLSDLDLRMWAVEQAVPLCRDEPSAVQRVSDFLIAYVRGDAST